MHEDRNNREGLFLRKRRIELGLTQGQVAEQAEIEMQAYQRYEYGKNRLSNASMRIGLRICKTLEIDPYDIIFGSNEV